MKISRCEGKDENKYVVNSAYFKSIFHIPQRLRRIEYFINIKNETSRKRRHINKLEERLN